MNIPPYPSFGRENQTYPSAQGHCEALKCLQNEVISKLLIYVGEL